MGRRGRASWDTLFVHRVVGGSLRVDYFLAGIFREKILKLVLSSGIYGFSASFFPRKAVDLHHPPRSATTWILFCKVKVALTAVVCARSRLLPMMSPGRRYNPKGWVGYGEYRPGLSAFLFTWRDGDTSRKAMKLRKVPLEQRRGCVRKLAVGPLSLDTFFISRRRQPFALTAMCSSFLFLVFLCCGRAFSVFSVGVCSH